MANADGRRFYKYRGPKEAIRVLRDLQLAWSSPLNFNDPFDTQIEVRLGCTGPGLADAFTPEIERLIFSDEALPEAMDALVARVITVSRPLAALADPAQIRVAMRPGIYEGAQKAAASLEKYAALWPEWLRQMRVICVSELNDDILMWAHYADCHRGAAIEFTALPEKDSAFCKAQPVIYRPDLPVMGNADQWVKHVTGKELLPLDQLFETYTLTKSNHWAYEKEWRCLKGNPEGIGDVADGVTVYEVLPEEITAVYLGCKISRDHRDDILRLVETRVPHAKVYQGRPSGTEFKLVFERIR